MRPLPRHSWQLSSARADRMNAALETRPSAAALEWGGLWVLGHWWRWARCMRCSACTAGYSKHSEGGGLLAQARCAERPMQRSATGRSNSKAVSSCEDVWVRMLGSCQLLV
jgi:hypothetical protein